MRTTSSLLLCATLIASTMLLSSCGSGYALYNTRYIPTSGTNFGPEAAELPWQPPAIKGQPYPHSPSRSAGPRYQAVKKASIRRDIWDSHFDGDDSVHGRLNNQRIENSGVALPPATIHTLRK